MNAFKMRKLYRRWEGVQDDVERCQEGRETRLPLDASLAMIMDEDTEPTVDKYTLCDIFPNVGIYGR